ncbi:hypothetical protein BH18ACT11_BH18ACT11_22010 [soil metagenome]
MRTFLRGKFTLLFMTCAIVLAIPAIALADNTVADGDDTVAFNDSNMAMGSVCSGVESSKTAPVKITRTGNATATNTFANGATVTVTASVTGAGLSAEMASPNTITLPSNWTSVGNGTLSDSVSSTVKVNSSVAGAGSGTVTYSATGLNSSSATITRTDTMNVTWTTANCDTTPPVITPDVQGTQGQNGWYTSNVTVSWNVSDPESSITNKTGCDPTTISSDTAGQTLTCSATSAGGTDSKSVTIKRDATAPQVNLGGVSGTAGDNGWYKSVVTQTFNASDATSGLVGPSSFTKSSGANEEGSNVSIGSGSVFDNAGNSASNSASFKIDLTDPTNVAFVDGPAAGSSHYFGSVPAAPTCTADDAISGLKDCVVTGYSTAVGTHTMTATATDNAGRTATETRSYTVLAWTTKGFYAPVDMGGVYNTVKGGSTVPLKFELFSGATELTDTSAIKSLTATKSTCAAGAMEDAIEVTATGGTSLRYDSTGGQFIYNWKTPTGVGCYTVTMTAQDGSTITAYFKSLK